ncbi:MAG: efflux transporter outer membrane subunit [Candidatus Hydrogenedentota bacterium]
MQHGVCKDPHREAFWGLSCVCVVLGVLCISCARFAPPERDSSELPVPDDFSLYEKTHAVPERWWEVFESEELNGVVEQALEGNLTLEQVYARLLQAEMVAVQTGAPRFPTLDYSGDASISRRRVDTKEGPDRLEALNQKIAAWNELAGAGATPPADLLDALQSARSSLQALDTLNAGTGPSHSISTSRSYRFGLGSSYEVDLWGRVRAQYEAALTDLEAAREDVYAAMLSLSAVVVREWLTAVAQEQAITLVEEQLELNKTTLELIELRYRNGLATALDVFQQRQIVAETESLLPPLESTLRVTLHELAVLLGKQPRTDLSIETATLPDVGPLPEPGLPAELLANRPDVRAAGLRLRSADWRVSAARADRLPALRLTGSASYGADEWDLVFDNWVASLAAGVTGPIFDAGRRKAEVERTRAVVDERLAAYRESVLVAAKEVESAMFEEVKQMEYIEALERQLDAATNAHDQALLRYRKGLNDYLPVLSALSQLQVVERRLVQAELTRLDLRLQLCTALGGSWMASEYEYYRGVDQAEAQAGRAEPVPRG